jgi:molybdenum cofactor cytidylyltransferase
VDAPERVFALVLAAGESRRLGQPKQLLDLAGRPLVTHSVAHALAAPVDGVVVVLGSHASEVELALRGSPVYRVFNPHFAQGQGASLAAGIRAIPSTVDAVVVLLGDEPSVAPETIGAVVARWREGHPPAVVTRYPDRQGHPVLFDRSVFFDLASLEGDVGGREILRALGELVATVEVAATAPSDVDTEEDWERLQRDWG